MRELFDARLSLDDKPMSTEELMEAVKTAECTGTHGNRPYRQDCFESGRSKTKDDRELLERASTISIWRPPETWA